MTLKFILPVNDTWDPLVISFLMVKDELGHESKFSRRGRGVGGSHLKGRRGGEELAMPNGSSAGTTEPAPGKPTLHLVPPS